MYVAMNRFRVAAGKEDVFMEMWSSRETYLDTVPGFKHFAMLKGDAFEGGTTFVSHTIWESRESFNGWVNSDAFRKAHRQGKAPEGTYLGPPKFEGFEAFLELSV